LQVLPKRTDIFPGTAKIDLCLIDTYFLAHFFTCNIDDPNKKYAKGTIWTWVFKGYFPPKKFLFWHFLSFKRAYFLNLVQISKSCFFTPPSFFIKWYHLYSTHTHNILPDSCMNNILFSLKIIVCSLKMIRWSISQASSKQIKQYQV